MKDEDKVKHHMRSIKNKFKKDIKLIKSGSTTLQEIRNQEEDKEESSEEEVAVPEKKIQAREKKDPDVIKQKKRLFNET